LAPSWPSAAKTTPTTSTSKTSSPTLSTAEKALPPHYSTSSTNARMS
jgi:hypothetical protein